ncbi:MAG: glycosyltransferase family A protein [Patescibacteria group bacterium]|jgi:glycosyltransferase involved in cell wall biosynthesis
MINFEPVTENTPIDVIITSHNYGRWLARAIESVLHQSVGEHNIIVVDDASTDNTEQVVQAYPAIQYIRNPSNLGCIGATKIGLKTASAPLLVFLDADDELLPSFTSDLLRALQKHPTAALTYGQVQYTGERQDLYQSYPYSPIKLVHAGNYISKTCLTRRRAFDQVGGFRDNMSSGQEDWDLWLSYVESGFYGVYVPKPVFRYTIHPNSRNSSVMSTAKNMKLNLSLIRHNHPKLYDWRFKILHPLYMAYWLTYQKLFKHDA